MTQLANEEKNESHQKSLPTREVTYEKKKRSCRELLMENNYSEKRKGKYGGGFRNIRDPKREMKDAGRNV